MEAYFTVAAKKTSRKKTPNPESQISGLRTGRQSQAFANQHGQQSSVTGAHI